MSSGRTGLVTGRLHRVLPHAPVDLVRDPATKSSHSLLLGVTACPSVLDVVVSPPAEPHLGNSDAVEHHVELPIAAAVEAGMRAFFPTDRNRSPSGVPGQTGRRPKSRDAPPLAPLPRSGAS